MRVLERFGPFDPARAARVLERLLAEHAAADLHTSFYLDAIRADHGADR